MIERRAFLASLAATLASAAKSLPANRNIKWAVSAGLWSHYPVSPFTDILDVMRDTGFIGVRLTGYPGILKTYNLTAADPTPNASTTVNTNHFTAANVTFANSTPIGSNGKATIQALAMYNSGDQNAFQNCRFITAHLQIGS